MTLATTPPINEYVENGVTLIHPVDFQFGASAELVVSRITGGVETLLVLGADYNVAGGLGLTGSITKANGGVNGTILRIRRHTSRAQSADYTPGDAFPAESHEDALDRLAAVAQEIDLDVDDVESRAIRVPAGEAAAVLPKAADRVSRILGFDVDGLRALFTYQTLAGLFAPFLPAPPAGPPGGNVMAIGLFTGAAGLAVAAGTNRVQTSGHTQSGVGAAAYVYDAAINGAFVAAHPTWSFLAADGRGFRLNEPILQLEFFGAIPGDWATGVSADCVPAFTALIDYIDGRPRNIDNVFYKAAPLVMCPGPQYYFSDTINIKRNLRFAGMGIGFPVGDATIWRWPAGKIGIIGNAHNTSGAGTEGVPTTGGQSMLDGITLRGAHAGGAEGEFHGIWMRGRMALRNIMIRDFPGDGLRIEGGAGTGGSTEGNSNGFYVEGTLRIQGCRNGIYCDGADVNAGLGAIIDVSANRQWGIWDSSFLGNTWVACHADSNGLVPGYACSVVSYGGSRYVAKVGQEVGASTNAPTATTADNTWWYYQGAGGVSAPNNILAWTNGMAIRSGGAYRSDGINAETLFLGCYSESGQGFSQGASPTLSIGGGQGAPWKGGAVHLSNYLTALATVAPIMSRNLGAVRFTAIESGDINERHLRIYDAFKAPGEYTVAWLNNDLMLFNYSGAGATTHRPMTLTGPSTANPIGTHKVDFPILFGLAGKKVFNGPAAPTVGTFVQGDMCFNDTPAISSAFGWRCIAGGTPGTWEAIAVSSGGITGGGGGGGGGGGDSVSLTDQFISKAVSGGPATATYKFNADSTIKDHDNLLLEHWLLGGAAVNFEVMATVISGAVTAGGSATGAWLAANANQFWKKTSGATLVTCTLRIDIRAVAAPSPIVASATVTLEADGTP